MDIDVAQWAVLLVGAAGAGWVDAVIGGGGLVLIPLLLAVIPGLAPATALATNKLQSSFGTSGAVYAFARRGWTERSARLREEGLRQATDGTFAEYYEPFTGEALGSMQQSWTAASVLDWLD